jgi:hypothetical protein
MIFYDLKLATFIFFYSLNTDQCVQKKILGFKAFFIKTITNRITFKIAFNETSIL